jgi:hypothetical protein
MYVYLTGFTFYHTAKFLYSLLLPVVFYCLQFNENVCECEEYRIQLGPL